MDNFWKTTALILITVVLCNLICKQEKDIAVLLSMIACCIAIMAAVSYLNPILDFLQELEKFGQIEEGFLSVLIKAVGIGFVSEIAGMICTDAGNSSLGKTVHMLGTAGILYLSLPVFRTLVTMIQEILGHI